MKRLSPICSVYVKIDVTPQYLNLSITSDQHFGMVIFLTQKTIIFDSNITLSVPNIALYVSVVIRTRKS